jgi:hypothetical protein
MSAQQPTLKQLLLERLIPCLNVQLILSILSSILVLTCVS